MSKINFPGKKVVHLLDKLLDVKYLSLIVSSKKMKMDVDLVYFSFFQILICKNKYSGVKCYIKLNILF